MKHLALGGAVGPSVLFVVTVVAGFLRPGYSHRDQFISELGATGSPYSHLMNYAGLVPTGVLFLAFAISIRSFAPRSRLSTLALGLLIVFAAGCITAGLAPCDVGCPQGTGSLSNRIHDTVSPLAFFALILACAVLGLYFRGVPAWRPLWFYSIATSIAALAFMVALVASLETRALTGLWQRLLLTTLFIWSATVGIRLYSLMARGEKSNGRSAGSVAV